MDRLNLSEFGMIAAASMSFREYIQFRRQIPERPML